MPMLSCLVDGQQHRATHECTMFTRYVNREPLSLTHCAYSDNVETYIAAYANIWETSDAMCTFKLYENNAV